MEFSAVGKDREENIKHDKSKKKRFTQMLATQIGNRLNCHLSIFLSTHDRVHEVISPLHSGREQRRVNAAGENLKSSADHVLVVAVEGAWPIRQAGRSFHLQGSERERV